MKNVVSLVLVWLTIFLAFPFSISQAYDIPYIVLIPALTGILLALNIKSILVAKMDLNIFAILMLQMMTACIWLIIHDSTAYINLMSQYFVALVIYGTIVAVGFERFVESFKVVLVIMSICSLLIFLLGIFVNVPFYEEFKNPDGRSNFNFIVSFSNTVYDVGAVRLIRPSGFFDEPGSLAFYLVVMLIINELSFKNNILKYTLIVCGFATLSVAFYIIVMIYLAMEARNWFNMKTFLGFVGVFLLLLYFVSKLSAEQEAVLKKFTVDRVESLFEEKETAGYNQGNNRQELIENAALAVSTKPFVGLGLSYSTDPSSLLYGKFMGANIVGVAGIHGIIGGLIFSLHLFYLIYVCFKYAPYKFDPPKKMLLLYILLILQRPDYIGGILTYVAVFSLILIVKNYYLCHNRIPDLQS